MEEWRPVCGWPLYEASSEGRVRRAVALPHGGAQVGRVLRVFWHSRYAYGFVTLSQGTKASRRTLGVHKVVALAFLGPCPVGKEAAHRDHNPAHNIPPNLEYLTHAENMAASAIVGRVNRGERHPKVRLTIAEVREIRQRYQRFSRTQGTPQLAREYGVAVATIGGVVQRRTWN